jgi:hypothetical protein
MLLLLLLLRGRPQETGAGAHSRKRETSGLAENIGMVKRPGKQKRRVPESAVPPPAPTPQAQDELAESQIEYVVDKEAEPGNLLPALAKLLRRLAAQADTAAATPEDAHEPEKDK